jgi:hypothetical protein
MIKGLIFLAITLSLLAPAMSYASERSNQIAAFHKKVACKAKIDPKNLNGAALKSEWHKCMVSPDSYN